MWGTVKTAVSISVLAYALAFCSCAKETPTDGGQSNSGLIAFTAIADSSTTDLDIYVIDSDDFSPTPINVSNSLSTDCNPVWLHDRSGIIYISSEADRSSLYHVDPASLSRYLAFASTEPILKIFASPTQRKLAYFRYSPNQQQIVLSILDLNTLDTLSLINVASLGRVMAAWSPDGTKLAVRAGVVIVFDVEHGNVLYNINATGDFFAWDESGQSLYLLRAGDLFQVDTLQQRPLVTGMNLSLPAISPDRRLLACVSQQRTLVVIDLAFADYRTVKDIQVPFIECQDERIITWSTDSRQIAFIDFDSAQWDVFTAERDNFFPINRLTHDEATEKALAWSSP